MNKRYYDPGTSPQRKRKLLVKPAGSKQKSLESQNNLTRQQRRQLERLQRGGK